MDVFLDRTFAGLTSGSLYVLLALALVVVFRASGTINFAQGEFALFTSYVAWWLTTRGLAIPYALLLCMALGFVMGVVVERTLIRPVARHGEAGVLIVCLGLFGALNGLDGWIWGPTDKVFPSLLPRGEDSYFDVLGSRLQYDTIGVVLCMILVVGLLQVLFRMTPLGLQMRAVATNSESAALSGIRIGRVLSMSWGLSATIGSLAGVLIVPTLPPNQLTLSGFIPVLIAASAAALLGGLDSIKGAVFGGIVFGVGMAWMSGYATFLGGTLELTAALVVIVGVLTMRPAGVFGTKVVERV